MVKAIVTCVDYADLLAITLPWNRHYFEHVYVVTTPQDKDTLTLTDRLSNVTALTTTAFYRDGSPFNKAAAIEEAFDATGRDGWICLLDADTVLTTESHLSKLQQGCIYSPYRRMAKTQDDVLKAWNRLPEGPERRNGEFAGYCQIFHESDPVLERRPWYDGDKYRTAYGCDSEFWKRWPPEKRKRPAWEVLHLGDPWKNHKGRITERWAT